MSKLEEEDRFINHYRCSECNTEWQDDSPATNNDRCPECDAEIEPFKSTYIETGRFVHKANIYKEALEVQDAVNLSGVVRSFARITEALWDEAKANGLGTEFVNQHPVSRLYADKIVDLAGVREFAEFSKAYEECERLSKEYEEREE